MEIHSPSLEEMIFQSNVPFYHRDKPNTPNSFLSYSIVSGNDDRKFSLEGSGKAVLVLRKKLDFEAGDKFFNLTIVAEVRPRLANIFNIL